MIFQEPHMNFTHYECFRWLCVSSGRGRAGLMKCEITNTSLSLATNLVSIEETVIKGYLVSIYIEVKVSGGGSFITTKLKESNLP